MVTRGPRRRMWLVVAAQLSCFPGPLDESGRQCDAVNRPCNSGYVCFDGICYLPDAVDAGPSNWLEYGDFERLTDAGLPLGWRDLPVASLSDIATDTAFVHGGRRSARSYFPGDAGNLGLQMLPIAEVRGTSPKQRWCARAWARTNSIDGGVGAVLFIRERDDAGMVISENTPQRKVLGPNWVALEEAHTMDGAERLDVRVVTQGRLSKTDQLWVDDVQLKRTATDDCRW